MEFKKEELIKSPINYAGGKYRLLRKGLLEYFPDNINTFVDLFCGAGNVGINVKANNIVFNDYINYIIDLFKYWNNTSLDEINKYINDTINIFNLSSTNKESFLKFRDNYNKTKDIRDLFILICYSFNYQMRFNNKQEYNSSFGKEASTMNNNIRNNLNGFINKLHNNNVYFFNKDFREINLNKLNGNDFVYLDPPYSVSRAVYQDGKRGFKGWNKKDDIDLFNLCDELNNRNIKFAMSNLLSSKSNNNEELIKWSNKYNIIHLDMQYKNYNTRKSVGNDDEVLITNY